MKTLFQRIAALLPVLGCMGNSCMCSQNGCAVNFGSGPPTSVTVKSVSLDPDPVQANSPGLQGSWPCNRAPAEYAGPQSWTIQQSDGSVVDASIMWPGGNSHTHYTINYWIDQNGASDPGNFDSRYVYAITDALIAWNNVLVANATGSLNITLSPIETQSSAQVQVTNFSSYYDTPEGGTEAFVNIPLGKPLNQTVQRNATITIDVANLLQNANYVYASAAHEIGHSLGLRHDAYASSIMYPYVPVCINTDNQPIPSWDSAWVESSYDPVFVPSGVDKTQCKASRCYLARKRALLLSHRVPASALYQGNGDAFGTYARSLKNSAAGIVSVHPSDHAQSLSATLQSLYLSSTLVARVSILPGTRYVNHNPKRLAIRRALVTEIYRHVAGPDANVRIGDVVPVVDEQPMETNVFLDDPPLDEGSNVLLFLRKTNGRGPLASLQNLHVATYSRVSKVGIDSSGFMYAAGSTTSQMAAQLNAQSFGSLFGILTQGIPGAASFVQRSTAVVRGRNTTDLRTSTVWDEPAIIKALLQQRGIRSAAALTAYEADMYNTRTTIPRRLVADDARRAAGP